MALKCEGCKAYCCRIVGRILKELDRGDGICLYLNENNRCEIYDHRPFICNTDRVYEKYFKDKYTKDEWINMNLKSCEELKNAEERKQSEMETEIQKFEEMEGIQGQDTPQTESGPDYGTEANENGEPPSYDPD